MPWPDIFYKRRDPRPEPPVPIPAKAEPIVPKPGPVQAAKAPTAPLVKSVSQAMAEADTLRTLTRSGGVRLIKRPAPTADEMTPPPAKINPLPDPAAADPSPRVESQPIEPAPKVLPSTANTSVHPALPGDIPTEKPVTVSPIPSEQRPKPVRRKARLLDFARLILPPKRTDTPPTVIPASFSVPVATGNVMQGENGEPAKKAPSPAVDISLSKRTIDVSADKIIEFIKSADEESPADESFTPLTAEPAPPIPASDQPAASSPREQSTGTEFKVEPPPAVPLVEPAQAEPPSKPFDLAPALQEKREFHLANGERILGRVLSETPDAIYLEHATLGVLTLPRNQIAKRLVEIILINGDRIVGDIVAETPECLFVRHASLGMLTVPQTQRSTRVVEAILKDGDRILGEVLAETDTFTVIRSASLGTITVKHEQVAMLNRKLEQVELKALPPALDK